MNPDLYVNISLIEAEQMSVDEDYQCELIHTYINIFIYTHDTSIMINYDRL
jgi:hypothetical protein